MRGMRRVWFALLTTILLTVSVIPVKAAIASVGTPFAEGLAANGGTTATAFNSTGANLIVVCGASYFGATGTSFSDSVGGNSNTWTQRTGYTDGISPRVDCWDTVPAFTGGSHTFTWTGSNLFGSLCVMAFSGADATPFDQQNGANAPIDSKPGAITPTGADYLFISATALESASTPFETINPIFTSESVPLVSSTSYGLGCGYYIQSGGPTAVNPEWDHGLAVPMTLITYQPSAGGGGGATCAGRLTLLGVGGC